MHTQNNLVFLAIKLHGNSNEILKTDFTRRCILKKFLKIVFYEKVFENQLHKQSPTRHANLFTGVFGKLQASSDYYKRDRTRNLRTCCAKVLIENDLKKATRCTQVTYRA